MSKEKYLQRYLCIINCARNGADFRQINASLQQASEIYGLDLTVSKRTLIRELNEIRNLFHMDIRYEPSQRKYIIHDNHQSSLTNRLVEMMDTFNSLALMNSITQFIYFDNRRAAGTEHLYSLVRAIRNRKTICFTHHKYSENGSSPRTAEPYALKEFKGRWYLVAKDHKDGLIKTFGLDRISGLKILSKEFTIPGNWNIDNYFRYSFGIIAGEGEPEEIILSFAHQQGNYVKSYPLHQSQQIIKDNSDELRIQLHLRITFDLIQELLSYGELVRVVAPYRLRSEVRQAYSNALANC